MLLILTKLQNDSIVIVLQKWKKRITLTSKFVFVFNYLNVSHRRKFFIELISSRYYGQLPLATVWPITIFDLLKITCGCSDFAKLHDVTDCTTDTHQPSGRRFFSLITMLQPSYEWKIDVRGAKFYQQGFQNFFILKRIFLQGKNLCDFFLFWAQITRCKGFFAKYIVASLVEKIFLKCTVWEGLMSGKTRIFLKHASNMNLMLGFKSLSCLKGRLILFLALSVLLHYQIHVNLARASCSSSVRARSQWLETCARKPKTPGSSPALSYVQK